MDINCEMKGKSETPKYNLRCTRHISEKMTKKDFVYDIRTPFLPSEDEERASSFDKKIVMHLKRKDVQNVKAQYSIVSREKESKEEVNVGDICVRKLLFRCNFCDEFMATRMSLSTHVKSHCRHYCKTCFWIPKGFEDFSQHHLTCF